MAPGALSEHAKACSFVKEVWAKLDHFRLGWTTKVLQATAAVGLLLALVAVTFPPECRPSISYITMNAPLDVFFILDASESISAEQWMQEKAASVKMIDAFAAVFGTEAHLLHVGIAQFSSQTAVEIGLTDDLDLVRRAALAMTQLNGGTSIAPALDACALQLKTRRTDAAGQVQPFRRCRCTSPPRGYGGRAHRHLRWHEHLFQ